MVPTASTSYLFTLSCSFRCKIRGSSIREVDETLDASGGDVAVTPSASSSQGPLEPRFRFLPVPLGTVTLRTTLCEDVL